MIRMVAPQNLSGSWRVSTENGLSVNKSSGTSQHQLGERVVKYSFHEPHIRGNAIRKDGIKILVVGDSFTFGWLVNIKDSYVQLLQEYADKEFGTNQFQFINAAAGGWGTADYVAYIEDFGELINPDIVLVFINTDDIGRSLRKNIYTVLDDAQLSALKRNRITPSALKKLVNSIPGYQWLLEHSHLMQIIRTVILTRNSGGSGVEKEAPYKQAEAPSKQAIVSAPMSVDLNVSGQKAIALGTNLFSHLKQWSEAHNATLLITTTGWHSIDAKTPEEPTKAFMSVADEYFKREDIPFVDISSSVSTKIVSNPEQYIIAGDGHPTESGHQLIGSTSWQLFIKSQLSEYCRISKRCNQPLL